ncbi:alkaline phosphatase PhoX [Streptomyces sp. NPDC050164]|uniref:alkaline phosphatase PhoX n=1 Tax=Streptomyces sp. NPDC050164 TaxID=3365605 RepID=UPI0037B22237
MGRFNHEAIAIDPVTGYVYETEDRGDASLYRFVPTVPGDLSKGGRLEALRIGSTTYDTRLDGEKAYGSVSWVPVDDVDPETDTVRLQAQAGGAAVFSRLDGAWYGNDRIYVITTDGGPARQGQVFELDPATDEFRVLFASPGSEVLNAPDNMCVSPRGGLVLCEDGGGTEYVHGLTTDGEIFRFAANNADLRGGTAGKNVPAAAHRGSEWAPGITSRSPAPGPRACSLQPGTRDASRLHTPSPASPGGGGSGPDVLPQRPNPAEKTVEVTFDCSCGPWSPR